MHIKNVTQKRIVQALASQRFFSAVVGLLVVQATWIALTARYPMAFDEDVWLGIIRLFAEHKLPFWSAQPAGADTFGAVVRDPSYVFFYLMSFPYTVLTWLTGSVAIQVICLRMLNVGLFAWGLYLYRRVLLKTGASAALVHLCMLIFVLVPIVPMLAGQINYDNLALPLVALALLLTIRLHESLKRSAFDGTVFLQLLAVCLLGSMVKYTFLPMFLVIVGFVVVRFWQTYRHVSDRARIVRRSFRGLRGWPLYLLVAAIALLSIGFVERYGVNLVRYHTPVPDCAQVLSYDHCKSYGPWIRDYNLEQNKPADFQANPLNFSRHWVYGMWFRSFFAVDGPLTGFQTRAPLLIPGLTGILFSVLGVLAAVVSMPRLMRRYSAPVLWLFVGTILVYVAILWLQQYQMYVQTARPVAINGRYLLPVLPLLLIMAGLALNELLGRRRRAKLILASVLVLGFLWGGGAATYVLRSNDAWYWPNSIVKSANHGVRNVLGPLTPGYNRPTQFLP